MELRHEPLVLERGERVRAGGLHDERVLAELARQVGLALHNVRLDSALQASLDEVRRQAGELQASRARIVAAADAERRRIERDLHDGAQQHLVALAVNLRLVRDLVGENPDAAEMLEMLADSVKDTIQELRDLAHGIYPPLLRERGLGEALRAAALRSPLACHVTDEVGGRLPAEVEAAVYFCCLEAMQNAGKYAGADATIEVVLRREGGVLCFEVRDDGAGFDAAGTTGQGFVNMADRVGALDGTVQIESAPGRGTSVTGRIPLPADPPDTSSLSSRGVSSSLRT